MIFQLLATLPSLILQSQRFSPVLRDSFVTTLARIFVVVGFAVCAAILVFLVIVLFTAWSSLNCDAGGHAFGHHNRMPNQ